MGYAGGHRVFTYASLALSAISALMALIPFLYIWMILRDVLAAAPDYAQTVNIPHYGWMAVLFAVLSYLVYVCALLCSHLSAFRVATNLRLAVTKHLAELPLGFTEPSSNSAAASCAAPSQKLPERRKPTLPTNFRTRLRRWRLLRDFWRCC